MRRVLIVDDHRLVASVLTDALSDHGYQAQACPTTSDEQIAAALHEFQPSVVLLDLELGIGRSGIAMIPAVLAVGAGVVVLTASSDVVRLAESVEAGAGGLLSKAAHITDVIRTIETVAETGSAIPAEKRDALLTGLAQHRRDKQAEQEPFDRLTPREQEVLAALIQGKTAQMLAEETFTSVRTVRGHIQGVLDKLGVSSQLAAVAKARSVKWRPPSRGNRQ